MNTDSYQKMLLGLLTSVLVLSIASIVDNAWTRSKTDAQIHEVVQQLTDPPWEHKAEIKRIRERIAAIEFKQDKTHQNQKALLEKVGSD